MHTTDSQVIARCAVKHFATDGRRRRRIAVERDSNVRLSNLNVREVNNITPDEQRLFFITQQITGMSWCGRTAVQSEYLVKSLPRGMAPVCRHKR